MLARPLREHVTMYTVFSHVHTDWPLHRVFCGCILMFLCPMEIEFFWEGALQKKTRLRS